MPTQYEDEFIIRAPEGFIRLKIAEVYGFPNETCHWGGFDTQSTIEIKSGSFKVNGNLFISTGNIYNFFKEFEEAYKALKGIANLVSYENNLNFKIEFDGFGHAKISGTFKEFNQELNFELNTDQTFLNETLASLRDFHSKYGDNKGVVK